LNEMDEGVIHLHN